MLNKHLTRSILLCNGLVLMTSSVGVTYVRSATYFTGDHGFGRFARPLDLTHVTNPAFEDASDFPWLGMATYQQVALNKNGASFVARYLAHRREDLEVIQRRSEQPFQIIDSVLTKYGLPLQLKYLAVIESELKTNARSHVGARGPWQLMPSTARILGLSTAKKSDDRTNYYKSTVAAAKYLRDLYAEFDDWLLVLAAYNGGPKPVRVAIRKSHSEDFWTLQKYLPRESRNHVKKFIATHYFFEGRGSVATLTKEERESYHALMDEFVASENFSFYGSQRSNSPSSKGPGVAKVDPKPNAIQGSVQQTSQPTESSLEKFNRLMKSSENALKKSQMLCKN